MKPYLLSLILISLLAIGGATVQAAPTLPVQPQESLGTSFTYQAYLEVDGRPANGNFDLIFQLFDSRDSTDNKGLVINFSNQSIHNGVYTAMLDFTENFDGQVYYLQVSISPAGLQDYITLEPRQPIIGVPNAQFAEWAKNVIGPISLQGSGDNLTNALIYASAENGYHAIVAKSTYSTAIEAYSTNGDSAHFATFYSKRPTNYPEGLAAYLDGNVVITGQLSQPAVVMQVEHPTDPQNKVLNLAVAGSTEQTVTDSGNINLGPDGSAVVKLPDWFTAVAGDLRYQLTPVGAPAPGLYVASEVQNNQFSIAGGPAGLKVSWQVTGTRQDAYEQAHPFQAEQPKTGKDVQ